MAVVTRSTARKKAAAAEPEQEPPLRHAPPPWHSVALVGFMWALFLHLSPSFESLDHIATVETFTTRLFPDLISLRALVYIRAAFLAVMVGSQIEAVLEKDRPPVVPSYLPHSKLQRNVKVSSAGCRVFIPFTSWAWTLLEACFGVSTWITWKALHGEQQHVPHWLLRLGVLLFEASAPMALLVASVVRYAIWPAVLANSTKKNPTDLFKTPRALLWHNGNVVMALIEVSLLGGLPVRYVDLSVSAIYGLTYIVFTWSIRNWLEPSGGPQFLYYFFDTTVGIRTTVSLVVLLLVLIAFYGIFCVIHQILDHLGGGPIVHGLAVVVLSSLVCRFRD